MNYAIENGTLVLTCDAKEQQQLRDTYSENPSYFGTHTHENEFCEGLISNSELEWIEPEWTGDLTDAPMLGMTGRDDITDSERAAYSAPVYGWRPTGHDEKGNSYAAILNRWAFMDYQLRSFLTDLMEKGEAKFVS